MKGFFRDRDLFGHDIKVNFNRKGDTHNTYIGGLFSIGVRIVYILYMAYLAMQLWTYDNDNNYVYDYQEPHESMISHQSLGIKNYNALYYNTEDGDKIPLFYNETTQKYINVQFSQMFNQNNYKGAQTNNRFKHYQAEQCSEATFVSDLKNITIPK